MLGTRSKILVALAAATAGVAVIQFGTGSGSTPTPAPQQEQPAEPEIQAPTTPPRKAVATPPVEDAPEEQMLAMPDGSRVPLLNGVEIAPTLVWGDHPWSPIVGKEVANGYEWYVHEDGSKTTTLTVWRSDLGRMDATAISAHPTPTAPMEVTGKGQ